MAQVSPPGGRKDSAAAAVDDPVRAFVELEHYNAVGLIQKVHRSLVGLSKVIRGSILVDESVSKLADKLMSQETPPGWQSLWEGPEDPIEYIKARNTLLLQTEGEIGTYGTGLLFAVMV